MSAKWRALQHRHKYTYSAVIFPQHFSQALNQTPYTHPFFTELNHLISLTSTYSQLEHVKKLASAFSTLLSDPNSDSKTVSCAVKLFLETLFLENSLPLHRTLVSVLGKCNNYKNLIGDSFRSLCEEYGGLDRIGKRRFCVARVALSMMSTPKLGYLVDVVEECAVLVGMDVVLGLHSVVLETKEWSSPSPVVMEQCQEALSCMYYLLQRFPGKFQNVGGEDNGMNFMEMAFMTVLSVMNSTGFSRDCFVAAGVSLFAALQVCLGLEELGVFIMEGIFQQTHVLDCNIKLDDLIRKFPYDGDLVEVVRSFSALSRLCLIRGILTAVSRTVLNIRFVSSVDGYSVKTILYDAIMPELCNSAENPRDGHSNFHTLTVMQICLQQIKTLLLSDAGTVADKYSRIPEDMGARILKVVWNNLEDPLSQTVKQIHLIFDLYLDIQSSLQFTEGNENIKLFLRKIASDLLHLGPRCKGRYNPLASLTRRLGAKTILEMNPNLLFESINAYVDDDVCCAVTSFLKCFLECLRDEYWSTDGVDNGFKKYRGQCLQPCLLGLASGLSKLRSNLNTYALPILFELDADSIFYMLALIGIEIGEEGSLVTHVESNCADMALGTEQKIAILASLLKVCRVLALMEGDIDWCEYSNFYSVVVIKGVEVKIPVNWLILALTHVDETLRMDAAETLFLNPKTASLPSLLELNLMKKAVPLNMRCCSTGFQMKWNSLFRKFFSRVRVALERQLKHGTWRPLVSGNSNGILCAGEEKTMKYRADNLFDFMKWLSCFLFFSCYPSAPYERKIMAMELILIMLNIWPAIPSVPENQDVVECTNNLYPYSTAFLSPNSTLLLVGSIIDSWDKLRENSYHILLYFPTPLPGISSPNLVQEAIKWAKKLVCSPRVRESDAGALAMRLLFRKYVLELRWIVKPSSNAVSLRQEFNIENEARQTCMSTSPIVVYVTSLVDWLLFAVENAEKNLSEACKSSFVHGILLTLRYTFEELDWISNALVQSTSDMKCVLERLLDLVMRITSLALGVVSADAWYLPDDNEEFGDDDDALLLETPDDMDVSEPNKVVSVKNLIIEQDVGPSDQIVMVGCWLAMKEVSLLLGTVIRKVPLPTLNIMENNGDNADESVVENDAMIDFKQLETIGNHFLEVLLKMKHNGAIDKTRAGFTALCNRLLCSNDPRLCKLTESWMDQLMERTVAKGQTVDDLLRRSAGIPAAFIALFLSEPEGSPKRLLPKALRWLIDLVKKSVTDQNKSKGQLNACNETPETNGVKEISKVRDEGVVPTVHAFNVLRAAFNDTNLATDTSGFSAEALIFSVRSFSSPYWEVRNSATLAYTALVRRMVGFLNVHKRESARRALTGLEFFHRYPALHPFFFNELKVASELLPVASQERLSISNLKNVVHPSLCPMLILLSRLKPSPISTESGDTLDPFLFTPFIRKCSIQSNYRIRVLSSKALSGLVSNEKLQVVLSNLASELPPEKSYNGYSISFNLLHGTLLQINSLVDTNCRDISDSSKKDMILHELIQILGACSWMGRPKFCACPTLNGCFLKLLDNMLSIARTCEESKSAGIIWNLLWELSSESLDLDPSNRLSFFDSTVQEFRKQAATSYFNCSFHTSKELVEDATFLRKNGPSVASRSVIDTQMEVGFTKFQERLIFSLADELYEVRIATLKWLLLFMQSKESSRNNFGLQFSSEGIKMCLAKINLQDTLMKLLYSEKHHKCICYILKIIYAWNLLEFQDDNLEPTYACNMDYDSIVQLWDKLVHLLKITRHAKTQQTLICCMGICIKRISTLFISVISSDSQNKFIQADSSIKFSDFYNSVNYFTDLIEKNSEASEPITMRKAAAESMIASDLLSHAQIIGSLIGDNGIMKQNIYSGSITDEEFRKYGRKILNLWLTCVRLLEDEDVGLRKKLALDVQKYLQTESSQVEKVIELCFDHLSTIFGNWTDFLEHICNWVFGTANSSNYMVSGGDLVRRVFDKEIDNHHEEKLLICQLCCSHLEKLPISMKSGDVLHKWRNRINEQVIAFAREYIGKMASVDWIGGVGNHKDAFLPVYANLLVFYALSNCILKIEPENSASMLVEVSAIGYAIKPFLGNSLICNLFSMVIKSHEKCVEDCDDDLMRKWSLDDSIWDEFNPYFLLG